MEGKKEEKTTSEDSVEDPQKEEKTTSEDSVEDPHQTK